MGTYRLDRSYDWNYAHGPSYDGPPVRAAHTPLKDFFGVAVHSRIGIAAGLLLNARWIEFYARMGFDILTYKTVRSRYRKCYRPPNWVYIDRDQPINGGARDMAERTRRRRPSALDRVTSSVSFGMPSRDPELWMPDVGRARAALGPGQALIVSVVATPEPDTGAAQMAAEFGQLAAMAKDAGAQIVEANLSCPNVCTAEGDIFMDPALSGRIAAAMRQAVGRTPVLLKIGYIADNTLQRAVLRAVDGGADGVILVNGVSRPVVTPAGTAAFGWGREIAGILGAGIRDASLDRVRHAAATVAQDRLALRVIGVGGVATAEDVGAYFDAGAYAVMMGSAPMYQPDLAAQFKALHPEW